MSYNIECKVHDAMRLPVTTFSSKTLWFVIVEMKVPSTISQSNKNGALYFSGHVRWKYSQKHIETTQGWNTYIGDVIWSYDNFKDIHSDQYVRNIIMDAINNHLRDRYDRAQSKPDSQAT